MADQMTFKRYELKYLITTKQYEIIKKEMKGHMKEDEHGKSTIQSLYFDTPDYLLIRRSIDKPDYKEKLRLRSYGLATDESKVFLELKKKYNKVVYKRRISMSEAQAIDYITLGKQHVNSQISREIDYARKLYPNLAPRMLLSYEREAYYENQNHDLRITFDQNILCRNTDVDLHTGIFGNPILPEGYMLMEIKTGQAIPLWLTHVLSTNKIYKTSFSKYGTAYKSFIKYEPIFSTKESIQRGVLKYA